MTVVATVGALCTKSPTFVPTDLGECSTTCGLVTSSFQTWSRIDSITLIDLTKEKWKALTSKKVKSEKLDEKKKFKIQKKKKIFG